MVESEDQATEFLNVIRRKGSRRRDRALRRNIRLMRN